MIVAHALTGGHVDDATTALDLIDQVEGDVSCLTADAAYDTRGIYEAANARGAPVVIPPTRTAPCLDGDPDRPRVTARSGRCSGLDGDSGRRSLGTIGSAGIMSLLVDSRGVLVSNAFEPTAWFGHLAGLGPRCLMEVL